MVYSADTVHVTAHALSNAFMSRWMAACTSPSKAVLHPCFPHQSPCKQGTAGYARIALIWGIRRAYFHSAS